MNNDLILSTFTGAGLLDIGFEHEGYCVVSGGDIQFGRDVRCFHPVPNRFDGIIGGPPCQAFSKLAAMVRHNGLELAPNLIPEFERIVGEARPRWFLMENVEGAPLPAIDGYHVHSFLLNNRWLGEVQNRLRRFSFGHIEREIDLRRWIEYGFLNPEYAAALTASGSSEANIRLNGKGKPKKNLPATTSRRTVDEYLKLQGLPADFFDESPLTIEGKRRLLGNGVPVPMARAVARAIRESGA
jgi:DNA (cytosine-5)-methyltransferase 1